MIDDFHIPVNFDEIPKGPQGALFIMLLLAKSKFAHATMKVQVDGGPEQELSLVEILKTIRSGKSVTNQAIDAALREMENDETDNT